MCMRVRMHVRMQACIYATVSDSATVLQAYRTKQDLTPRSNNSTSKLDESSLPNITSATDMTSMTAANNNTLLSSPGGSILTHTNNFTLGSSWSEAETPSQATRQKPTPAPVDRTPKWQQRPKEDPSVEISTDPLDDDSDISMSASKFGVKLKRVASRGLSTVQNDTSADVSRNLTSVLAHEALEHHDMPKSSEVLHAEANTDGDTHGEHLPRISASSPRPVQFNLDGIATQETAAPLQVFFVRQLPLCECVRSNRCVCAYICLHNRWRMMYTYLRPSNLVLFAMKLLISCFGTSFRVFDVKLLMSSVGTSLRVFDLKLLI